MILSGSAVQVKGLGLSLVSARKRLMAACSSTIDRNTPRLSRRRVSLAKKPSTAVFAVPRSMAISADLKANILLNIGCFHHDQAETRPLRRYAWMSKRRLHLGNVALISDPMEIVQRRGLRQKSRTTAY